ncbi:MAG: bi-domain-containing oxidoreductase [Candidatus Kapabacteria bacterium]|nr:bi-domain-containing oxidoreductase [Candidatus Kapabacteria bacterium]
MLQVVQHQKTGIVSAVEVPHPQCQPNSVIVKTFYSLISAGTERTSVTNSQGSMLQRAKKQPAAVRQVIDMVKKDGLKQTYDKIQSKLDSYKSLGYSVSGVVVESRCEEFAIGDRVACAGAGYANHAEYVSIPKNLVCKLPDSVSFEDAAYTTLASIALQGVRQADIRLGETVAVVGLGLLGQITVQLLKSSGCKVIGLDIDTSLFPIAEKNGCDLVLPSTSESLPTINSFTRGYGTDAVIITAGTSSNQPVELAITMARKKSSVVVVGAVSMNVPRSPFYEKEIELKISCSYGPGRYDPLYEEEGIDYPVGYVRWTENRNMEAILDLLSQGALDFKALTTHTFQLDGVQKAYGLVTGESKEFSLGILLQYDISKVPVQSVVIAKSFAATSSISVGFIGLGNFAQSMLLPPLKEKGIQLHSVANSTPTSSRSAAERNGFQFAVSSPDEIIANNDVTTIFCASRHDSHFQYVLAAIEKNKPVFVEKPLCLSSAELKQIAEAVAKHNGRVMVGFNRRFSASFAKVASVFQYRNEPMMIHYRVNAGFVPKTLWVQHAEQGGRIIGEVCHFVDTLLFLTQAKPVSVFAKSIQSDSTAISNYDNVSIIISFSDGSVGSISYLANGDSSLSKEYCEVHCENKSAIMNNFQTVDVYKNKSNSRFKFDGSKGQKEEVFATIDAIKNGKEMPIPFEQLYLVTKTTFAIIESLSTNSPIQI